MKGIVLKLPALLLAALLVLPPGICCWQVKSAEAASASAPVAGCPACPHCVPQATQNEGSPAGPAVPEVCCCPHEALLPDSFTPDDADQIPVVAVLPLDANPGLNSFEMTPSSHRLFGPRLHVLHCVWRC